VGLLTVSPSPRETAAAAAIMRGLQSTMKIIITTIETIVAKQSSLN